MLAQQLLDHLLDGPSDPALKNAVPSGTTVDSFHMDGQQAVVDLSYAYSALSGIALTMADYCITLTLTQLDAVSSVRVTVRGQELAYRDSQDFAARDVLFSSTEDVVGQMDVTLYFLDSGGNLTPENRTIQLYEGDTQLDAILTALQAGPAEDSPLLPSQPEDFQVRALQLKDATCYVNLPSSALPDLTNATLYPAMQALVQSLGSLPQVEEVQFLVDGEYNISYGDIPTRDPWPVTSYGNPR